MPRILWNVKDDLNFYEQIYNKNSEKYSVVFTYLNAALYNKQYRIVIDDIGQQTNLLDTWILLQEIDINSGIFLSYLISPLRLNDNLIYFLKAGQLGDEKIYQKSEILFPQLTTLVDLVFNKHYRNPVDVSNYKVMDGTMYYLTTFNGSSIGRIATYHPTTEKENSHFIKVINIIRNVEM